MTWLRHRAITAIALYLALLLATTFLFNPLGTRYLDAALLKAGASFGVAQGLNALISVVQDSSVSAGFVLEGNIAVGQVLDPLNDLTERFAQVMLFSLASLGLQKLLAVAGPGVGLVLFALALGVLLIGFLTRGRRTAEVWPTPLSLRLLILAIVAQAALPLTASLGALVSNSFLHPRFETAETALATIQNELQLEVGAGESGRWFERLDPRRFTQSIRDRAGELTTHLLELITLFLFETLVLPLLTLAALLYLSRTLFEVLGKEPSALRRTDKEPG